MVTKSGDYKEGELANRIVEFGKKILSVNVALGESHNQNNESWAAAAAVEALSPHKDLDEQHRRIVEALTDLASQWIPRRKGSKALEELDLRHSYKERAKHLLVDFRCVGINEESSVSDASIDLERVLGRKMTLVFRIEKRDRTH